MPQPTQAKIAEELGISRQALAAWKRSGIDTSAANMTELRRKAAAVQERRDIAEDLRAARLRKLTAEADMKEHQLAVEEGRYILASDAHSAAMRAGAACRAAWEQLEADLPPQLEGLSALQMAAVIRAHVRSKMKELSEIFASS